MKWGCKEILLLNQLQSTLLMLHGIEVNTMLSSKSQCSHNQPTLDNISFNLQYIFDRRQTITPIHGEWSNLQTNKITPKWHKYKPKWKVHSQEEPIRSDTEFVCALVVNYLDDYCASLSQRWFSFCDNNHVSFDLHALFVHIISKQSFRCTKDCILEVYWLLEYSSSSHNRGKFHYSDHLANLQW